MAVALFGSRYNCSVLGIAITLTINYGVKQNQFIKPASEPRASDLKNLMRHLTARLEVGYCNINVANHRLITVIRFVVKSYTHF